MKNRRLLDIVGEMDDRYIAEAAPGAKKTAAGSARFKWGTAAACAVLVLFVCFGAFATVAEAKEYRTAVRFFADYGMSTDGLTRGEIKAVYRDISTNSFSYAKTAEVIRSSISAEHVWGYEILQDGPAPEDVEALWDYKNRTGGFIGNAQKGIHYRYHSVYKEAAGLGFEVHDKSYLEKYEGDALLWSVSVSDFCIEDHAPVSDGVIAYGRTAVYSDTQDTHAWLAKIDSDGKLLWKQRLDHGFEHEYIAAIVEEADGSYAVISRGELKYFCLSRFSSDGKQTYFSKTDIGNCGIWNAASFGDGYIVQLGSYLSHDNTRIVKVDADGTITESFSYSGEDAYYYITDMIEFNGSIYLSAYAVPRLADEDQSAGGRYEIAAILNVLFDNHIWDISEEELTPMVRDNYTAMLLVCDPTVGTPREFYSVKGSLGGKLSVSTAGELLWDVESITTTFFSPATSSFTIGGTSHIFRYTFDSAGALTDQEKTGETVSYRR